MSIWQVILSVLAAMFGVQKSKNQARDFEKGNFWVFAIVAVGGILLFIGGILLVVHWVLP